MLIMDEALPGAAAPETMVRRPQNTTVRSWPLVLLAAPASVAVWSGWVGIGQMTGFGLVRPLPGIADSVRIDTAITLPLGVEAYAAFALRAWFSSSTTVSARTRRYARWSAIGSLVLGMAGQVAYHLLTQSGTSRAPWEVTTLVSCLPVLVLGMGAALAHMLHADASDMSLVAPQPDQEQTIPGTRAGLVPDCDSCRTDHGGPDADQDAGRTACLQPRPAPDQDIDLVVRKPVPDLGPGTRLGRPELRLRFAQAQSAAAELAASGKRISRRSLREAGVRGSNADLNTIARMVGPQRAG